MNSAECWQYLPVKVNILLSEFFWQLISDSWTCYRINSVPKSCCRLCISNDNEQGRLHPYTCEHSPVMVLKFLDITTF
jgi:hypothetical protein